MMGIVLIGMSTCQYVLYLSFTTIVLYSRFMLVTLCMYVCMYACVCMHACMHINPELRHKTIQHK